MPSEAEEWVCRSTRLVCAIMTVPSLCLPAGQIGFLFRSQRVDGQPHGGQLHSTDLIINGVGHLVQLGLQLLLVLDQPLQTQRLDGEGHIHDLRRMAVAGGQVHQAAFAHHVQGAAIGQGVTLDVFTADIFQNLQQTSLCFSFSFFTASLRRLATSTSQSK